MPKKDELTARDHALRATAAGIEPLMQTGIPMTAASVGHMALAPYIRKLRRDIGHVPAHLRTETADQLANLTETMLLQGGRDPDVGREVHLNISKKPGGAAVYRELFPFKGQKAPRDILRAGLNISPESLAHEVGHLTAGSKAGKALQTLNRYLIAKPAWAVPSALAATALLSDPGEEPNAVAKAAPYIGGAHAAGLLAEEMRANLRGFKILKDLGHKTPLKQQIGRYLSTATYLRSLFPLVAAPAGILAGVKAYDEARAKKRPLTFKGMLLAGTPSSLAEKPSAEELKKKWAPHFK